MVKPISLRLRSAEIRARAEATLIRAGRADDVKRAHSARVMREARATVARAREQNRLRRCAKLAAFKAIAAVREAYAAQNKIDGTEFERERWLGLRDLVLAELARIAEGKRPLD